MIRLENKHKEIIYSILEPYPYKFYVYGSRAKGTANKYSDLDLCFQEEIPWNIFSKICGDLEESDLPFKVDLVYWEWMSPEFQGLIKSDLIPLGN